MFCLQKFPSGLVRVTESCVNLVLVSKNGYHDVDVMYYVGSDDCLVLKDGWKKFVEEAGLQAGDVVMAMFYRHAKCLVLKVFALDQSCLSSNSMRHFCCNNLTFLCGF